MTAKEIAEIIEKEEYEFYGIRKDSAEYKPGETVRNSHQFFQDPQWADDAMTELLYPLTESGPYAGYYDAGELPGACAIRVTDSNIAQALDVVECYNGKNIYLVSGSYAEPGNDPGEIIIENAEVLGKINRG